MTTSTTEFHFDTPTMWVRPKTLDEHVAALPDDLRTSVAESVAADPHLQTRGKIVDHLHNPQMAAALMREAAAAQSGPNTHTKQRKRAYTVIVTGPGHMIGDKALVEAYTKKKAPELPPWYGEWADLLPHWHLAILETPYDVEAFFRGARIDTATPRVGFIANTKLSLSCGKALGGELRDRPYDRLRAATMLHQAQREGNLLKDLRKRRKATTQVEATASASDDESENDEQPKKQLPMGVSLRTLRRDALLRQIASDGTTQPLVRAGVCCPTCGHRHLSKNLLPSTPQSLRKEGLARVRCEWCDTSLGQDTREQDSVLDRKIPVFTSESWLARAPRQEQRVVTTRFISEELAQPGDPCRWFGTRKPQLERYPLTRLETCGTEPILGADGQPMYYRDSDGNPVLLRNEKTGDLILDAAGQPQPMILVREIRREIPLLDKHGQQAYGFRPLSDEQIRTVDAIPWGERPRSNPRMALGVLIGRRHRGELDLYLADECHEYKGATTAMGRAFGLMFTAARRTVGLTGTLYGGYASDIYYLLLRCGNRPVREQYGWHSLSRFVEECGVTDRQTKKVTRADEAGHFSGEPRISIDVEERPGITAYLASIIQNCSVQVLLKHMGFKLVDYDEDLVLLNMPKEIGAGYKELEARGKDIISWQGNDALSSYLQSTLLYPYAPWRPKTVASKRKQKQFTPMRFAGDIILPHHEWLAAYAAQQIKRGRRVLIYCEHTSTDDIMSDVEAKITALAAEQHGVALKVATLRSTTVKPGARRAWFAQKEADGYNVVICNPRLVKTGLNLIGWPSIVVLEPVYSLYTLFQAKRRAFRPTQTQNCEVVYVAYKHTMSHRAVSVIARKAAAAAILSGDDLAGIMEFDPGMSLMQELANAVTREGDGDMMNEDIRALLKQGARALKHDQESGMADFIGVNLPTVISTEADELAEVMAEQIAQGVSTMLQAAGVDPTTEVEPVVIDHDRLAQVAQMALDDFLLGEDGLPIFTPVTVKQKKGKKGKPTASTPTVQYTFF